MKYKAINSNNELIHFILKEIYIESLLDYKYVILNNAFILKFDSEYSQYSGIHTYSCNVGIHSIYSNSDINAFISDILIYVTSQYINEIYTISDKQARIDKATRKYNNKDYTKLFK
jgi:hypothetical protein